MRTHPAKLVNMWLSSHLLSVKQELHSMSILVFSWKIFYSQNKTEKYRNPSHQILLFIFCATKRSLGSVCFDLVRRSIQIPSRLRVCFCFLVFLWTWVKSQGHFTWQNNTLFILDYLAIPR